VLHFSRSDRKQTPPPLDLRDLAVEIEETVRAFAPLAAPRGVGIRTDLAGDLVVAVDSAAFRQLLLNLLDNAVKYGPQGQTVTVRAERAGDVVRLTVADEGPGVPPAERERVWEPFYRGRGNGVRAVGGSGIGLAVVRDAVERHGGTAWLDDSAAPGTRVVIELPAPAAARAAGATAGAA
jgi:signal transduction histidine kinase